jgi:hypothetical protein
MEDRTRTCSKMSGRLVVGSERLNKPRDSWFSAKAIEVARPSKFEENHVLSCTLFSRGVEHFLDKGPTSLIPLKLRIPNQNG